MSLIETILLKVFCERFIVEEDVRVVEFPVEPVFDLLHAAHDTSKVTVPH